MAYVGNTPTTQSFISGTDYFNGDGSTTAFTLSRTVVSPNDVEAVINNVVQQPNSAYTISGTTITFTSAPSSGTSNIYVRYLSTTTQSITPSQNTVSYSTWNSDLQNKTWGFKNRIINGAMVIDQRNAGASISTSSATNIYSVDRWNLLYSQVNKFTAQQNQGSVTPPAGFTNYLGITSSSAYSSLTSTDYFLIRQNIEGYNFADLGFGTANAKTFTISFWVRSSLTGTFGGALDNASFTRGYPFSYTISSANTWEYKTITIVGDTSGTWNTTNDVGLSVNFSLGTGTLYSGTGTWANAAYLSYTGATNVVGTNGATFYITGVQLEVGSSATNFDYRNFQQEFAMCQRYYEQSYSYGTVPGNLSGSGIVFGVYQPNLTVSPIWMGFAVEKRASPTIVGWNSNTGASGKWTDTGAGTNCTVTFGQYSTRMISWAQLSAGTGNQYGQWTASAEL